MNKQRVVVLLGSSNSFGNTRKIVDELLKNTDWELIDLKEKSINHFDYDFNNQSDDFLPLMKDLIENYDIFVFATPVYWYTMSGIMKVFFDRISDLLKIHQAIGRQLRGKKMAIVACGADTELVKGFYMPFRKSAEYLGMEYLGDFYGNLEENSVANLKIELMNFRENLLNNVE